VRRVSHPPTHPSLTHNPPTNTPHPPPPSSIDTLGAPQNVDPSKDPIPYPDGTFKIAGTVSGEKNCVYSGTASGPGSFQCDGLAADQTSCFADPQEGTNYTCVLVDGSEDTSKCLPVPFRMGRSGGLTCGCSLF